jgi:hypothetical protein
LLGTQELIFEVPGPRPIQEDVVPVQANGGSGEKRHREQQPTEAAARSLRR